MGLQIEQLPSPNRWTFNNGYKIICLHGTAGGDSIDWLRSPGAGVSASFEISKNGRTVCLVDPYKGYSAWANGIPINPDYSNPYIAQALASKVNLNSISISIEHEAASADMIAHNAMPAAQLAASQALVLQLCHDFKIPVLRSRIIGHYQIDSYSRKNCPGVINLDKYVAALQALQGAGEIAPPDMQLPTEIKLNGHTVRGEFLAFYRKLFNPMLILGQPLTDEYIGEFGYVTQVFERKVLQFYPLFEGAWRVQGQLLGAEYPGPYPAYSGPQPGAPSSIDKHVARLWNPLLIAGRPLSDVFIDKDNRPTQVYERDVLKVFSEFANTDWLVQGQRLGADFLKAGRAVAKAA